MTAIILPKDLEDWARAEVAAGRAKGVEDLVAGIVRAHRDMIDDHREDAARKIVKAVKG